MKPATIAIDQKQARFAISVQPGVESDMKSAKILTFPAPASMMGRPTMPTTVASETFRQITHFAIGFSGGLPFGAHPTQSVQNNRQHPHDGQHGLGLVANSFTGQLSPAEKLRLGRSGL